MRSMTIDVVLVISVAAATIKHKIKFITHGSTYLKPRNSHPIARDRPDD